MMKEEAVFINSESEIKLEALVAKNKGIKGLLVAHPHPLYGGNMYNNVVEAVIEAYQQMGYTTVRFNFRGVGKSTGSFDNGIGERDDIKAGFRYLLELGKKKIGIAGYSFGAYVVALSVKELSDADHIVLISPPVSMVDFSFLKNEPKIKLVITGAYDQIAPVYILKSMVYQWNSEAVFKVINTDHFYWGQTESIKEIIVDFLSRYENR